MFEPSYQYTTVYSTGTGSVIIFRAPDLSLPVFVGVRVVPDFGILFCLYCWRIFIVPSDMGLLRSS